MSCDLPSYEIAAVRELDNYPNWVVWAEVRRRGEKKPTKPPFAIHGGYADTTNPDTWAKLGQVCEAIAHGTTCKNPKGVGFVFSERTPYAGIDLDNCRDPATGKIQDWALRIIERLNSYTEVSPSKRGLHVLVRIKHKFAGRKRGNLEVYSRDRYFTVTGWHYGAMPESIEERTEELQKIVNEFLPVKDVERKVSDKTPGVNYGLDPQAEPPKKKFTALYENDRDFARTWDKKRTDLPSQSEYEMSLMMSAIQAKWTPHECAALVIAHRREHDPEKIDKVMRQDYIDRTYRVALAAVSDEVSDADVSTVEAIKSSVSAGKAETLSMLSSKLGADISGAIRRGSENTQYYLIVGGRECRLGEAKDLLSIDRVRANIFDITGKTIKGYKRPVWFKLVEAIFAIAELQEIHESSRGYETVAWINDYLETVHLIEEARWKEGLINNKPFYRDDKVHMHLEGFRNFLRMHRDVRLTARDLRLRLKEVNMEGKKVVGGIDGTKRTVSRYFWVGDGQILLSDYFKTFIPEDTSEYTDIEEEL